MDFWLGNFTERTEKIEIAAFVGLSNMLRIKRTVAARIARGRRRPRGAAARHLVLADVQMNTARGHVHLDLVARVNQGERSADEALRRDVQDAGAVAGAAHARIGY